MQEPWSLAANTNAVVRSELARRVNGFCLHEGRLTAMRWLICFVRISGNGCYFDGGTGKHVAVVGRPRPHDFDVFADMFGGGEPFPDKGGDAEKLALVWKGCAQATGHPTQDSNHPLVKEPQRAEALEIILPFLQRTIWDSAKRNLFADTVTNWKPWVPWKERAKQLV